jgi:hypothetical protein
MSLGTFTMPYNTCTMSRETFTMPKYTLPWHGNTYNVQEYLYHVLGGIITMSIKTFSMSCLDCHCQVKTVIMYIENER